MSDLFDLLVAHYNPKNPCPPPEVDWTPPRVADLPTLIGKTGRIGIDCETKDPRIKTHGPGFLSDGRMIGFSFAIEDGPKFYLPLYHLCDNVEDPERALQWARDNFGGWKGETVGANIPYDLGYFRANGIRFTNGAGFRDVQIAEPLLNEYGWYNLKTLSRNYLGVGKSEDLMDLFADSVGMKRKDIKSRMDEIPGRYVGLYGEDDADLPLKILRLQEAKIEAEGLSEIYQLESELIELFHEMKWQGVPIDTDQLDKNELMFQIEEQEAYEFIKDQTGVGVSADTIWKAPKLAPVLEHLGIEYGYTPSTGAPSITKDFLAECNHPVTTAILTARQMQKFQSTFVEGIRSHLINGRIHPNYNQLPREMEDGSRRGTVSGRPSMTNPNLLQQPVRNKKYGDLWRSIFSAEPDGAMWNKNDYSSQEPRMTYHFASILHELYERDPVKFESCEMPGIDKMVSKYAENPLTDCHQMTADLTGLKRGDAKAVFLGSVYGMGTGKLARSLGLGTRWVIPPHWNHTIDPSDRSSWPEFLQELKDTPKEIGDKATMDVRNKFNRELPFLKALTGFYQQRLHAKGHVKTLLGRRCRKPMAAHKALNRGIQGSSADQTKKAMLLVWKETKIVPYLQVYDELDSPVGDEKTAIRISEIMEEAVQLRIPTVVEPSIGPNWGVQQDIERECYAKFIKSA